MKIGGDEEDAGESESGEEGEEAGVPQFVGVEADDFRGAETKGKGGHEADCSENAEGGEEKMAGVEEVRVHVLGSCRYRRKRNTGILHCVKDDDLCIPVVLNACSEGLAVRFY